MVGYLNRDGRANYNFFTPCFEKVDGKPVTIQDIQLSDSVEATLADLQILDDSRRTIGENYMWFTPDMAASFMLDVPEGMGAWVNGEFALPEVDPLQFGQVVQIGLPADTDGFKACGQVCDDDAVINARANYNFVGNPYPVPMSIQNIQCDASVEATLADLQILDSGRKTIGENYMWFTPDMAASFMLDVPEGMGAWVNGEFALPDVDPLQPGEGVQVGLPAAAQITVIAPIEL